ncbi:FecR domain-containing protein [Caldilinea sp.]|uniref:FecR domain-containing protein n=1 Tax=Caldilinea sp. TaxID=2293560 RepID=UPI002B522D55|nr:FecR domain-containing protein [Caldilinea sp.]
MSDLRGFLDDRDDADIQKLFDAFYETDTSLADFDERLTQLVLSEVRTVFAGETVAAEAVAVKRAPSRLRSAQRPGIVERIRHWLRNLQPRQSLALAGATALAVILIFFGFSRIVPRPLLATATATGGEVTILQQRTNTYRTYYDGDLFKLAEGDQVLTAGGTAAVELFPSQLVVIDPDSHVVIAELQAMLDTTQVELLVVRGRVNNLIDEPLQENDRYVVTSSVVEASVTGTEFSFETLSAAEVVIQTARGEVEVTREDQTVIVAKGEQVATLTDAPLIVEPSRERMNLPTLLVIAPGTPGIPVFAEPNEQARLIGFAADSVLLNVLGEDDSGLWYQICCVEQQAGWLKVDAIPDTVVEPADTTGHTTLDEKRTQDNAVAVADAEASPAPTSTSTETPIPTATPSETPVVTPTASPTASATASATRTATPTSPPTASPPATPVVSPLATFTPTPSSTATATPTPVITLPAPAPRPTDDEKKKPTSAPLPPTPTPLPPTLAPTNTPSPTPTPVATVTPLPTSTLPPQIVTPTPTQDVSGQATPTEPPPDKPPLIIIPTLTAIAPTPTDAPEPTLPPLPTDPPEPTPPPPPPPPTDPPEPTLPPPPTDTPVPPPPPTDTPVPPPPPPSPQPAGDPVQPGPVLPLPLPEETQ